MTISTTNDTIINNINNENVITNINIYQPILVNDNEDYNLDEILKTIPELKIWINENKPTKDLLERLKKKEEENKKPRKSIIKVLNTELKKKSKNREKKSTTQLNKEDEHIKQFKNISHNYGLKVIDDWGNGSKNKKENKDADLNTKISDIEKLKKKFHKDKSGNDFDQNKIYTVSCKTENGDFTLVNSGLTNICSLFKYIDLDDELKNKVNECNNKVKKIKKKLGLDNKWENIGQNKKKDIKILYINLLYNIFSNKNYIKKFLKWLNERQSDFKYIGDKLNFPENYKLNFNQIIVKKIKNDTIKIGNFKFRCKSSGGKVKASWKINLEFTNNNNFR